MSEKFTTEVNEKKSQGDQVDIYSIPDISILSESIQVTLGEGMDSVDKKKSLSDQVDIYSIPDIPISSDSIQVILGDGLDSVDEEELQEAKKMVTEAIIYSIENASTEVEKITAETLENLVKEGKVKIEDTSLIYGRNVFGYFHHEKNKETGENTSYIAIDYTLLLAYGKSEVIDTIFHEAYHAAQYNQGHENDCVEEETRAWNIGLAISNRYREEVGEYIYQAEPYTQSDILNLSPFYIINKGEGVFTELTRNNTEAIV